MFSRAWCALFGHRLSANWWIAEYESGKTCIRCGKILTLPREGK